MVDCIELMHGKNVFYNFDIISGFIAEPDKIQCCDVFYVFGETGYIRTELHHEIIELNGEHINSKV